MTRLSWCGVFACVIALLLVACGKREQTSVLPPLVTQPPVPATNVASVVKSPPEAPVLPETIAQIRGEQEVPVVTKLPGFLVRQMYKANAEVKKGDVLFLIDSRTSHSTSFDLQNDTASFTRLVASVSGVASPAKHGPGDWIAAGETLATVATNDVVEAEFSLAVDAHRDLVTYLEQIASAPADSRVANIELFEPDGNRFPGWGTISSVRRDGRKCVVSVRFADPEHKLRVSDFVRLRSSGNL